MQAELADGGRVGAAAADHARLPLADDGRRSPTPSRSSLRAGAAARAPELPFVSNVTGTWITAAEATDPAYWARHLRQTVRFAERRGDAAPRAGRVCWRWAPGRRWVDLARQADCCGDTRRPLIPSLRYAYERQPDARSCWARWAGSGPRGHGRLGAVHARERAARAAPHLPLGAAALLGGAGLGGRPGGSRRRGRARGRSDPAEWMYLPVWRRAPLPTRPPAEPARLAGAGGRPGDRRAAGRAAGGLGHTVAVAEPGEASPARATAATPCARAPRRTWPRCVTPCRERAASRRVIVLWGIDPEGGEGPEAFARAHARGYATVAALAATFAREADGGPFRLLVATEGVRDVAGGEGVRPERATVLGPCLALSQELAHVVCRTVDVRPGAPGDERLVEQLLAEALADAADTAVALRGARRWVLGYEAAPPARAPRPSARGRLPGLRGDARGHRGAGRAPGGRGARLAVTGAPLLPGARGMGRVLASPGGGGAAGETMRGIVAAEARGCAPLLLRADPRDPAALRGAVAAAVEAFGVLHGVVHAAQGAGAESAPLAEARSAAAGLELARLTRELAALEEATAGLPLDFLLLQNSIFSVFGGSGLAAATAAFVLGDAWAERCAARGRRWTSVSWDRWEEEGSSAALSEGAIPRARRGPGVRDAGRPGRGAAGGGLAPGPARTPGALSRPARRGPRRRGRRRPPGGGAARAPQAGERVPGAHRRGRGAPRRDLSRAARDPGDRDERLLLRAGWALPPGAAGPYPGARDLPGGSPPARDLRGSHRRRAGRGWSTRRSSWSWGR